ncbi:hypothetical protein ACLEPN_26405 [Myxococcus sp. 1LA]
MNRFAKWTVVAAGVLMAACGGEVASEEQGLSLKDEETSFERPRLCIGGGTYMTEVTYYTDATKTEEAGREDCLCSGVVLKSGRVTPYSNVRTSLCAAGGGGAQ